LAPGIFGLSKDDSLLIRYLWGVSSTRNRVGRPKEPQWSSEDTCTYLHGTCCSCIFCLQFSGLFPYFCVQLLPLPSFFLFCTFTMQVVSAHYGLCREWMLPERQSRYRNCTPGTSIVWARHLADIVYFMRVFRYDYIIGLGVIVRPLLGSGSSRGTACLIRYRMTFWKWKCFEVWDGLHVKMCESI
jgi:hypothetical protein